jgi:hypothetical protein
MESQKQLNQQFLKEERLMARLQQAASQVEAAEQERIWAIAAAHTAGLSIRKIAVAAGLSSSRVHQLLHTHEAKQIAQPLQALSRTDGGIEEHSSPSETPALEALQQQLSEEGEVLRWCIEWLEKLDRGESVVVNLRPPSDRRTAFVSFNQARVVQVLKRIAGTLARLSGAKNPSDSLDTEEGLITAGVKHRQRLAEPEPQFASLSQREQRAILREKMGLPPL